MIIFTETGRMKALMGYSLIKLRGTIFYYDRH
jgi:hypothetical protein